MDFEDVIEALKTELNDTYLREGIGDGETNEETEQRWKLVGKIEEIVFELLKNVSRGRFPVFRSVRHTDWNNSCFDGGYVVRKDKVREVKISLKTARERRKFVMITFLLAKIHKLLTIGKTCNRRELYYRNLDIFKAQKQVDDSMKDVSYILNAPPWQLGVLATSKGLVFGPLFLHLSNGEVINCTTKGGVVIPSKISDVVDLSSPAKWVLIIEKDTTFHRLLNSEASSRLDSCIVITGKGFPDASTRMLICKLWQNLRIPILALNDADPYGIEIMCVYRFGSASMSSYSYDLACPAVRWLGIHPTDIKPLLLNTKALTGRDVNKIHSMMERTYVKENDQLRVQLETLLKGNVKAELEALSNISNNFLVDVYVKSKIRCKEYY